MAGLALVVLVAGLAVIPVVDADGDTPSKVWTLPTRQSCHVIPLAASSTLYLLEEPARWAGPLFVKEGEVPNYWVNIGMVLQRWGFPPPPRPPQPDNVTEEEGGGGSPPCWKSSLPARLYAREKGTLRDRNFWLPANYPSWAIQWSGENFLALMPTTLTNDTAAYRFVSFEQKTVAWEWQPAEPFLAPLPLGDRPGPSGPAAMVSDPPYVYVLWRPDCDGCPAQRYDAGNDTWTELDFVVPFSRALAWDGTTAYLLTDGPEGSDYGEVVHVVPRTGEVREMHAYIPKPVFPVSAAATNGRAYFFGLDNACDVVKCNRDTGWPKDGKGGFVWAWDPVNGTAYRDTVRMPFRLWDPMSVHVARCTIYTVDVQWIETPQGARPRSHYMGFNPCGQNLKFDKDKNAVPDLSKNCVGPPLGSPDCVEPAPKRPPTSAPPANTTEADPQSASRWVASSGPPIPEPRPAVTDVESNPLQEPGGASMDETATRSVRDASPVQKQAPAATVLLALAAIVLAATRRAVSRRD